MNRWEEEYMLHEAIGFLFYGWESLQREERE